MTRIRLIAVGSLLLLCFVVPAVASQFISLSFDKVVRGSTMIVRGTMGPVSAEWDADREIIFSFAALRVTDYLVGEGPAELMIREVGGTVAGYTQQAIGFPELREGEDVVLFLEPWDDGSGYRIHAYRQGKYRLARESENNIVFLDPDGQGEAPTSLKSMSAREGGMDFQEFREMVRAAARGRDDESERPRR